MQMGSAKQQIQPDMYYALYYIYYVGTNDGSLVSTVVMLNRSEPLRGRP